MDGMFNFRAALEDYGFNVSDVTVNNEPRTLGNDTRGDDDGIIEDGEDWEYSEETCIEWRIYSGSPYVIKVDGKPIVSTNPDRYVHYLNYTQINEAYHSCDLNDGDDGDGNVTMWGEGDFSDIEIVADEDDEMAIALAEAYALDVGDNPVKYYYDSQSYHIKEDAEIRRDNAESADSNWTAVSLDCLLYTSPSPRDLSTSRMPSSA